MFRTALATVVALAAVSVAGPHAKGMVVDLTGRWSLTTAATPWPNSNPFGSTLAISQSANTVTLVDSALSVTYQTDQNEHNLPNAPRPANTVAYLTDAATTGVGTYRAFLTDAQLIVIRKDFVTFGEAGRQRRVGRVLRQAFTPSTGGSLVIDSLLVTDPLGVQFFNMPTPAENPPTNIRSVYRKIQ